MPEESHIEEMRAKIKGDRERAAKRDRTTPPTVTPDRVGLLAQLRRFLLGR